MAVVLSGPKTIKCRPDISTVLHLFPIFFDEFFDQFTLAAQLYFAFQHSLYVILRCCKFGFCGRLTMFERIGQQHMAGPTGGFLIGFLAAAMMVGYLAQRGWDRHVLSMALAMLIGNLVIYGFGLVWLGNSLGWDKPILQWGLYPFILGDCAKIVIAAIGLPFIWRMKGRTYSQ